MALRSCSLSSGNVGRGVPWLASVQSVTQWPSSLPAAPQWQNSLPASARNSLPSTGTSSPPSTPVTGDLLFLKGPDAIREAVMTPPQTGDFQPAAVYVDFTRNVLSPAVLSCLDIRPNTVILHVYDLNEGLTQANNVTGFHVGMGGAFHVGTEVYGGEWAYGTSGVTCDLPRSCTGHAYKCSVIAGCTELQRHDFAAVLQSMMESWQGKDYDTLGHNCCNFATELCNRLGCEQIPPWIDRFPRLLHNGQMAGQDITHQASQLAQQLPGKVKPHVDFAAHMGRQVIDASRAAMYTADKHAQSLMQTVWETCQSAMQRAPMVPIAEESEAQDHYDGVHNGNAAHQSRSWVPPLPNQSDAQGSFSAPRSTSVPRSTSFSRSQSFTQTTPFAANDPKLQNMLAPFPNLPLLSDYMDKTNVAPVADAPVPCAWIGQSTSLTSGIDTKATLPAYPVLDSSATLPAYPVMDSSAVRCNSFGSRSSTTSSQAPQAAYVTSIGSAGVGTQWGSPLPCKTDVPKAYAVDGSARAPVQSAVPAVSMETAQMAYLNPQLSPQKKTWSLQSTKSTRQGYDMSALDRYLASARNRGAIEVYSGKTGSQADGNKVSPAPAAPQFTSFQSLGQSYPAAQGNSFGNMQGSPAPQGNSFGNMQGSPAAQGNSFGNMQGSPAAQGNSFGNMQGSPTAQRGSFGNMQGSPAVQSRNMGNAATPATQGTQNITSYVSQLAAQANTYAYGPSRTNGSQIRAGSPALSRENNFPAAPFRNRSPDRNSFKPTSLQSRSPDAQNSPYTVSIMDRPSR